MVAPTGLVRSASVGRDVDKDFKDIKDTDNNGKERGVSSEKRGLGEWGAKA